MIRRIFVLATLVLLLGVSTLFSSGSASTHTPLKTTAAPVSCGSTCVQNLNFCNSTCNGNSTCLAHCQDEYECCQILCHGGTCRSSQKKDAATVKKAQ